MFQRRFKLGRKSLTHVDMTPNDLQRVHLEGEREEMVNLAEEGSDRVSVTIGLKYQAPGRVLAGGEQMPPVGATSCALG